VARFRIKPWKLCTRQSLLAGSRKPAEWEVSVTVQRKSLAIRIAVGAFAIAQPSHSQTVKVTPLGSHDNEFCALDRAMIFEDPVAIILATSFNPLRTLGSAVSPIFPSR
jgi:hypothetical protein